jgi:hypothetical protein
MTWSTPEKVVDVLKPDDPLPHLIGLKNLCPDLLFRHGLKFEWPPL